ncbi:MAG: 3'-5' exonuclease [Thermoplasmatota archaeon]
MPYIAIDLETTSTNPNRAHIVQIAVVLLDKHMVEQSAWQQLIRPGHPIPPEATARHGIRTEDVASAEPFSSIASRVRDLLLKRVIVGYNVGYDLTVLHREFHKAGLKGLPPGLPILDPYRIFCQQHPRTLEAAIETYCSKKHPRPHEAMQDVQVTLEVLRAQIGKGVEVTDHNQYIDAQLKWNGPSNPAILPVSVA